MSNFRGVIFDMGGVMVNFHSPTNIDRLIKAIKAHPEYYRRFVACELGHIAMSDIADFLEIAFPGIKDANDYENINIERYFGTLNRNIYNAAKIMQSKGIKVGILSNNWYLSNEKKRTASIPQIYEFDCIVESCLVGYRKPEKEIYQIALSRLGLRPHECIFVDDLEVNVKGAEDFGLKGIHLKTGNSKQVIEELESLLGVKLN